MSETAWGAIIGGTVLLLLGLYLAFYEEVSVPIGDVLSRALVERADPDFIQWLRWVGILIAVRGVYVISTTYLRPSQLAKTRVSLGNEGLSLLFVPLALWLRDHTEVIPVISLSNGKVQVKPLQAVQAVRSALNVLIVLILIGVAFSVGRIVIGSGTGGES
jgi:hypothetical protein